MVINPVVYDKNKGSDIFSSNLDSRIIHLVGEVSAGMAIYDTMQHITPDVVTICTGMAASMGAVILSGGEKGKRMILPHSEVMIHTAVRRWRRC